MYQLQTQVHTPLTTAHLAQTMTLLHMNALELSQEIEGELANNPALEMIEERHCPTCRRKLVEPGPCPICTHPHNPENDDSIVFVSSRDDLAPMRPTKSNDISELPDDNFAPARDDLPTYVFRQIACEIEPEDREIVAFILANLDDNGLLPISIQEICQYHHRPPSQIIPIIQIIQLADPVGVGSASVQEALLVQTRNLAEQHHVPPYTEAALRDHFNLVSRWQSQELAKQLNIKLSEAEETLQFISNNLNPYPAQTSWGEIHQAAEMPPQVYHQPDIIIRTLDSNPDSPLVIEVISSVSGILRVNPLFRRALKDAPVDRIDQWRGDLEKANLLIKCIQQRNNTMQRLMKFLAKIQRSFIMRGDRYLIPITRARIADELEVHESTISRAVAGKTVLLPNGKMIPLDQFFDRSLHIRAVIKDLIDNETKTLTDTQIMAELRLEGFKIARRTVAKYRSMEGILPAHLRRKMHRTNQARTAARLPYA